MSQNHHKFEKSSLLQHCDYHEDEGKLEVCFKTGATYHYECSKDEYEALKAAASPGGHFGKVIRPKYKGVKV